MSVGINIDTPDLQPAIAFYIEVFGLQFGRWLGDRVVELTGRPTRVGIP